MDSHTITAENEALRARLKIAVSAAAVLLLILLFLSMGVMRGQRPPVVLVPMQLPAEVEVGASSASDTYLTEYATQVCYIYLNAQPATFESRKRAILRLVHPTRYREIKAQIERDEKRMKEFRSRTAFSISAVDIEKRGKSPIVKVRGILSTLIGADARADKPIVLKLTFRRDGRGALLIHALEEVEGK